MYSHNHWKLSICVRGYPYFVHFLQHPPFPPQCLFPYSRDSGLANPAALLPSWGPAFQRIAKLQTHTPQEWAGAGPLQRGLINWQEHIFFVFPWPFSERISDMSGNDRGLTQTIPAELRGAQSLGEEPPHSDTSSHSLST